MIARREKGSGKFTNSEKTDKKYFFGRQNSDYRKLLNNGIFLNSKTVM